MKPGKDWICSTELNEWELLGCAVSALEDLINHGDGMSLSTKKAYCRQAKTMIDLAVKVMEADEDE